MSCRSYLTLYIIRLIHNVYGFLHSGLCSNYNIVIRRFSAATSASARFRRNRSSGVARLCVTKAACPLGLSAQQTGGQISSFACKASAPRHPRQQGFVRNRSSGVARLCATKAACPWGLSAQQTGGQIADNVRCVKRLYRLTHRMLSGMHRHRHPAPQEVTGRSRSG